MKRFICCAAIALASFSAISDELCDFYQPTCAEKKNSLDAGLAKINTRIEKKQVSVTAGINEASSLISGTYPNDPLMLALSSQLSNIAAQKIPESKKESLADGAFLIVSTAYQDRKELIQLAQSNTKPAKVSPSVAYQRAAMAMASEQQAYAEDNDPTEPLRRAVAVSALLKGIGKAFATSWGQSITPPSTICNGYGGTMYCYPPY